jgi:hypothetical protein
MKKQLNIDTIAGDMQPEAPRAATQTPKHPGVQVPEGPGTQPSRPWRPGVQTPTSPDLGTPEHRLSAKAEEGQTLRLTEAQFRHPGRVQTQLGEQLDVKKVDKNDIMRCAIHAAFEEYERTGEESEIVRRLRTKYR